MIPLWQAGALIALATLPLRAQEAAKAFTWDPPKVRASVFSNDLGMLDSEREEYATNLAVHAANKVAAAKASPASLAEARKLLSLALNLSPRNKRAVVVNFQLAKGVLPEPAVGDYSAPVFSKLLLTRGQLLEKQGGAENQKLARYFTQLAAEMDPKNEEAVYASEVQRLDHGGVDWAALTNAADAKP